MLLNYHIGRFVLDLMCVGVMVRFGEGGIQAAGSLDTALAEPHPRCNTQHIKNEMAYVVVRRHTRKLLKMGTLVLETCRVSKK